jgi:predicted nucleic acid-binding protein
MEFNIRNLNMAGLEKKKYFFDANIWLKILKPPLSPSQKDLKYLQFFERFRNHKAKPRIVVTALLLSEVINRYLRDVTFTIFCNKQGITKQDSTYYKKAYRPSSKFTEDYISLCEDIKAYQQYYELESDGLGQEIRQKQILNSPPSGLDFNDYYYYQLAMARGYSIVTDDQDFWVPGVEILTLNQQLVDKAHSLVKPKL